jgi:putative FmdB family regulatory protein
MSPIFDYECDKCKEIWESVEVWPSHAPKKCPKCKSKKFTKILGTPNIRTDSDGILHSIPDPCPPLEELRGKGTHGYADKPEASTKLSDYTRKKDKFGNTIWLEKKRQYYDMKKGGK